MRACPPMGRYMSVIVPQLDVQGMPAPLDLLGWPAHMLEKVLALVMWLRDDVGFSFHALYANCCSQEARGAHEKKAREDKQAREERMVLKTKTGVDKWEKLVDEKLTTSGELAHRFLTRLEGQAKQERDRLRRRKDLGE